MIQRKDVEHVAKLARLQLSEEEMEVFTLQLSGILDYVHTLEQVDTSQVEPTAHAQQLRNVFREDELEDSLDREVVLDNAPDQEGSYFKTPKILGA